VPVFVHADEASLVAALQKTYSACVGIDDSLTDLKKMAGINTAITSVGTATATGATIVGIVKSSVDKELRKILSKVDETGNVAKNPPVEDALVVYDKTGGVSSERQRTLSDKSKSLGNWRTGLLGTSTATNIAGVVIASNNKIDGDLQNRIDECIKSVDSLKTVSAQAHLDGLDVTEANTIANACGEWKYADLSVINNRGRGAMISSIVGATTGTVGTITSVAANSDGVRAGDEQKEKNLNTASNILAGGTAMASGVAAVFNATQISAIKKIAKIAENCEKVLK
jgi:hypothetical protein